jgi:hypothetical protein
MKLLAIDIGIINLALVGAELNDDYLDREDVILESEIFLCELIDITELIIECDRKTCELYHDKIICDYMMHLFKKFKDVFESVDRILIERQPIRGITAVQELIMREHRSKSELVSPNAMLNFFGILDFEYEERKIHTEKIAMEYLGSIKVFVFNERRHDMSDALCIMYYYLSMKRKEHKEQIIVRKFRVENEDFIVNMNQYRYNPQLN